MTENSLARVGSKELSRVEELELARREADARFDVARHAQLADQELLPFARARLDAWREWGIELGEAEHGGPREQLSERKLTDAQNMARHKARRVAEVDEGEFENYKAKDDPDKLTLAGLIRKAPRPQGETPPLPTGSYACVVIDPPWPMDKIVRDVRPRQGRDLDYPTMSLDEIEAICGEVLSGQDNCHIYLWVTQKYLPAGLKFFDAWGVTYQCAMTWVKNVGPTPFSWMYDTEHVLFGRRGSLPLEQMGLRLSFSAKAVGHSIKPDVFYERVCAASPGPRLAMFERGAREGFAVWGDEV